MVGVQVRELHATVVVVVLAMDVRERDSRAFESGVDVCGNVRRYRLPIRKVCLKQGREVAPEFVGRETHVKAGRAGHALHGTTARPVIPVVAGGLTPSRTPC